MRGKVEVFAIAADGTKECILNEPNLVVNGAGESIVDMLTTPSSVLGFDPRVMDTSNWRFGALSFGPAAGSFSGNAYFFPKDKIYMKEDDLCNGVSASVVSLIDQISTDKKLRLLWNYTPSIPGGGTALSYTPPYRLPSYPDPLDRKLEDASSAYSTVSGDGTQSYGQFENRICFARQDASSYFQGAYPPANIAPNNTLSAMLITSYEANFQDAASANMSVYFEDHSGYNAASSMDYRGFITTRYNETSPVALGNCYVSGSNENDLIGHSTISQVSQPTVTITTTIPAGDLWALNMYGGLHQIGLWNMDTPRALAATTGLGTSGAPLMVGNNFMNTTTGVTPQEYKLFAKKSFTNNLAANQDSTGPVLAGFKNTKLLHIQWTLDFRSGGLNWL